MASSSDALLHLSSIFPDHSNGTLARYLAASNGSLERATTAIISNTPLVTSASSKRRKVAGGLSHWITRPAVVEAPFVPTAPGKRSALESLRPPADVIATPQALPPLVLSTPELVVKHTNGLCTLILDVLPKDLATELFLKMIEESEGVREGGRVWEKNRWYMFDREVESPHLTEFYVERPDAASSAYDQSAFEEAAQYWYNGARRPASEFNAEINRARAIIGPLVRSVLSTRPKHPYEFKGDWVPNVAAANCYRGSKESVGYHSDVLTYLGPYPTIASMSLGVSRPFRLRPFTPISSIAQPLRTLDIPLPHNALLIMHAGTQEKYRHSIPEVGAVDLWRVPKKSKDDEVVWKGGTEKDRGYKERINMTFRFYRPDFAPLPTTGTPPLNVKYKGTPTCPCKIPCVLRPDGSGKVRAGRSKRKGEKQDDELVFFWHCNAGAQNEGKSCDFFQLLDFEKEARGDWFGVV